LTAPTIKEIWKGLFKLPPEINRMLIPVFSQIKMPLMALKLTAVVQALTPSTLLWLVLVMKVQVIVGFPALPSGAEMICRSTRVYARVPRLHRLLRPVGPTVAGCAGKSEISSGRAGREPAVAGWSSVVGHRCRTIWARLWRR